MFGKKILKNIEYIQNNLLDDSCVVYESTIVDGFLLSETVDGAVYIQSDIKLLKSLNAESSPALAESLSMRFSRRSSSSSSNVSDKDILSVLKSRYMQDAVELQSYRDAVKEQLGIELSDSELNEYIESIKNKESSVVDKNVESGNDNDNSNS